MRFGALRHIYLALALILAALELRQAARHSESSCIFPERWQGSWFQSGVRGPITILLNRFSTKGRCIASKEDKFLIVHENGICYRCVSIHEVHENVLQYKETFCSQMDSLSLCSQITGDALLYSMFRQNAVPLPCPFTGYHTFFYNRGHGECNTLASTMEPCTQDSRLLLRYQACPDVYGSESAVEELQCLATWKEGSSRYLVGKIEHGHITSNEDRYRCFVYDKLPTSGNGAVADSDLLGGVIAYRVAQSGDATCNGLFSPMEGSRTMTLFKATSPSRCKFPNWVSAGGHWHTLDHRRSYSLRHRNSTLRIADSEGREETRIQCSELKGSITHGNGQQLQENALIVGHYTVGCQSGYVCMAFYKRDQHVIELQLGTYTRRFEEACNKLNFDRNRAQYVTLVTMNPEVKLCPLAGRFKVTGMRRSRREERSTSIVQNDAHLINSKGKVETVGMSGSGAGAASGGNTSDEEDSLMNSNVDSSCPLETVGLSSACTRSDTIELRSECNLKRIVSAYTCHAGWVENGTGYVITTPVSRSSGGAKRYCFVYSGSSSSRISSSSLSSSSLSSSSSSSSLIQLPASSIFSLSTSADTCSRAVVPGETGALAFNLSHQGNCVETSSSSLTVHFTSPPLLLPLVLLTTMCLFS